MTRPLVRRADAPALVGFVALLTAPALAVVADAPAFVLVAATAAAAACVGVGALVAVRVLRREADHTRSATQALVELAVSLRPSAPLPPMTGWAAHAELAAMCARLVRTRRPSRVVELGSGVSTLVVAMALEANAHGEVISLDHDPRFAEGTRDELRRRGLAGRARVVDAPLGGHAGAPFYDLSGLDDTPIDLLVIDGPPNGDGRGARAPALDRLFERLAPEAVVVVDDAGRDDEHAMVRAWLARYEGVFEATYVDSQKGVFVLTRRANAA